MPAGPSAGRRSKESGFVTSIVAFTVELAKPRSPTVTFRTATKRRSATFIDSPHGAPFASKTSSIPTFVESIGPTRNS